MQSDLVEFFMHDIARDEWDPRSYPGRVAMLYHAFFHKCHTNPHQIKTIQLSAPPLSTQLSALMETASAETGSITSMNETIQALVQQADTRRTMRFSDPTRCQPTLVP